MIIRLRLCMIMSTPPPLQTDLNQYTLPAGLGSLRGAICTYYNKHYDLDGGEGGKRVIAPENVLVRKSKLAGMSSYPRRPRGS